MLERNVRAKEKNNLHPEEVEKICSGSDVSCLEDR
jgi:hypothetical protein